MQWLLLPLAAASQYATDVLWPLCGLDTEGSVALAASTYRLNGTFPAGWADSSGCPLARLRVADLPIRSTFGPRALASSNERYDFHRGIDLACPIGTPMFAIADGKVLHAGTKSSYDDPVIIVQHIRPGSTSCSNGGGCYNTMYLHARRDASGGSSTCCTVASGDAVVAGQLLGYSGASQSGFEHLHFEVRDATAADSLSAWQRDCIHPLRVLPYNNSAAVPSIEVGVGNSSISVLVTANASDGALGCSDGGAGCSYGGYGGGRMDIAGVNVTLWGLDGTVLAQAGDTPTGDAGAGGGGYNIYPSSFIFDAWNRQYTHKDSAAFPFASFGEGGAHECPWRAQHGDSYSAATHMDRADPLDPKAGLFNGVRVVLREYAHSRAGHYSLNVSFGALEYSLCMLGRVSAAVQFAGGGAAEQVTWENCLGSCGRSDAAGCVAAAAPAPAAPTPAAPAPAPAAAPITPPITASPTTMMPTPSPASDAPTASPSPPPATPTSPPTLAPTAPGETYAPAETPTASPSPAAAPVASPTMAPTASPSPSATTAAPARATPAAPKEGSNFNSEGSQSRATRSGQDACVLAAVLAVWCGRVGLAFSVGGERH
jgi:murein DD-endopeptidase MepM/ murein hydrolase activator NlpD